MQEIKQNDEPEKTTELAGQDGRLVMRVLEVTAKHYDYDDLSWRTDGEYAPVTFIVNCNDLFYWACADAVAITSSNIDKFEKAYEDATQHCEYGADYAQLLFCCRVREMRPQKSYFRNIHEELWKLFNACGEERTDA